MIGTRYAIAVVRFLVDFSDKEDVRQVYALQDAIRLNQERSGTFEIPHWDEASLKKIKAALLQLGPQSPTRGARSAPTSIRSIR